LARGEPAEAGRSAAVGAAPPGASVTVDHGADLIRVEVTATVRPPGPLLSRLPAVRVTGEAVAAVEPDDG
jgi:hypothetical protein